MSKMENKGRECDQGNRKEEWTYQSPRSHSMEGTDWHLVSQAGKSHPKLS